MKSFKQQSHAPTVLPRPQEWDQRQLLRQRLQLDRQVVHVRGRPSPRAAADARARARTWHWRQRRVAPLRRAVPLRGLKLAACCWHSLCLPTGARYTFNSPQTVQATAFGRDNRGGYGDRSAGTRTIDFRVQGGGWQRAGTISKSGSRRILYNTRGPLLNVIQFRITNQNQHICIDEWEVYGRTF